MRVVTLLTALAFLSSSQTNASPVPAPIPTMTNTGPAGGLFTNAFNFCKDLQTKYGNTIATGSIANLKRAPIVIELDGHLEARDFEPLAKRQTLSPALPLGRSYTVVPGSTRKVSNSVTYYNIGDPTGPCIVFSFGGSYFNGLIVTADPFRILYPAKLAGNSFATSVKICQAVCDSFVRLQSLTQGGSSQCKSINPWQSTPPNGDPFQPLGEFYVCDIFPYELTTNSFGNPAFPVKNGLIANANGDTVVGSLLGRDEIEN